jgi:hypothetical protein
MVTLELGVTHHKTFIIHELGPGIRNTGGVQAAQPRVVHRNQAPQGCSLVDKPLESSHYIVGQGGFLSKLKYSLESKAFKFL